MKILVTGGAGFIGSNVVDAYVEMGHDCIVVDNLYSGKWENLNPRAEFYLMDIRSDEFQRLVEKKRPHVINHHAAQISVPESVRDPRFDASVNIDGFLNVLEAARRNSVQKIIFISSGGAIYGEAKEYPTSEAYNPVPLSPYAIAKAVSEDYLRFYDHEYGLDYTVLRYANIYGPRQIPHGEAGVVAIFMDRLLNGKKCTIYHYEDDAEGMIRDYCFVGDVVEANILALNKGSRGRFNIGTGIETKTLWLYRAIFDVMDERLGLDKDLMEPEFAQARPGDLKKSCLNVKLAEKELGWKARHNLREGLMKTLDWRLEKE
ncbi:dTDP-glucose 4,6-dehydratase [Dissulfuribacter thermophilus]|uniref:dTDP-glucose 4,6-dehydratase n=1 Tax=Dissulfuribacter thermophilus TaxID=1156395 RepID=A0A1B9F8J4_9BACT|nr:NAD-dependent epimerase/dehydratase family protein [Dissulfuribacter thermophilus]OCC16101.1 dTDP-glucose 4,6-dehydratase [Dissulfuribacter thermophilus]